MLAGRFKILQIIGEGATSTVYRAFDFDKNREVAIKSLKLRKLTRSSSFVSRDDTGEEEYHLKEYSLHSSLTHEHILRVYEFFRLSSKNYIVTELCDGNLISLVNEYNIGNRNIKRIIRMVLLGLHYMHSRGIVHRDIKLGNILIQRDIVKICDFGLACSVEDSAVNLSLCGTKEYIPPEVRKGLRESSGKTCVTEKADIYAVGVVLKVLITQNNDSKVDDIKSIHSESHTFAKKLLAKNPTERVSAEEALRDSYFEELYAIIPDFRPVSDIFYSCKRGTIQRVANFAEITYKEKGEVNECVIRVEYQNGKGCQCSIPFVYRILVDGTERERYFLTESQLKYYNYLCTFLFYQCEKTVKCRAVEDGCTFVYYINGSYTYECCNMFLEKKGDVFTLNGRRVAGNPVSSIPLEHRVRLLRFLKRAKVCRTCVDADASMTDRESSTSTLLVSPQRVFIEKIGWCLLENDKQSLSFFLNDGTHFVIHLRRKVLICSGGQYGIGRAMPKAIFPLLRIARMFVIKFLNGGS